MADELAKSDSHELVGLLHAHGGDISLPLPFERDIFLFDTHVAGTSYVDGIEELEPQLNIGDKLNFFRETDNPHDARAIVIRNDGGSKLGYVPRVDNVVFSRLMDAGKLLFGRISSKEMQGKWLKIEIKIFLHE